MEVLCFFSGMLFIYFKNKYSILLPVILFYFRPKPALLLYFLLGICWAALHNVFIAPQQSLQNAGRKQAIITGEISSIPLKTPVKTQFDFELRTINHEAMAGKVRLSCYKDCPDVSAGQVWQFKVKLKKPQNLGNPGGFDYVNSLKVHHIEWIGYIKPNQYQFIEEKPHLRNYLLNIRSKLSNRLQYDELSLEASAILKALSLGIGSEINRNAWELFRRTGTAHLMVISGAHIGFVASLIFACFKWVWPRCFHFAVSIPTQRIAAITALIGAFIYSLLAGFGIPAERALIMCFFMLVRYIFPLRFTTWQGYRYALAAVLLYEPHSVLMPGFYLSFIAVAVLILANQLFSYRGIISMLVMQLSCLIGLLPLTLFLFSYGSINSFLANLIAIPWVGFFIMPLGLMLVFLGKALPGYTYISTLLNQSIHYLLVYLHKIDRLGALNFTSSRMTLWGVLLCWISLLLIVIFRKKQFLPVSAVLLLAVLYPKSERVDWGVARIDVLDVGQGLSILVRTAKHLLIYDTGVKFYLGSDMGSLAVIPYLKKLGTQSIDMIVISHPDLDHRGGLQSIERNYAVRELVVDDPQFYHRGKPCHQYPKWQWDGVSFQFLPMPSHVNKKNNHSCILKIDNGKKSMLLTGDIESSGERHLIKNYQSLLASTYLLVPHHGSRTSSTNSFLKYVAPEAAVVSYGMDNRYRHPSVQAMRRYQHQNIPVLATATCGLVRVLLNQKEKITLPICTKYHKS